MKHTPKHWSVRRCSDTAALILIEPDVAAVEVGEDLDQAIANANLIAVAPEMLEQLQFLVNAICEHQVTIEDCDAAKAVIAKAKKRRHAFKAALAKTANKVRRVKRYAKEAVREDKLVERKSKWFIDA